MHIKFKSDVVLALKAIYQDLLMVDYTKLPPSLISGVAGHILFLYEYYQFSKDPAVELAVQQRFSWLEDQLDTLDHNCTFSYGLTGIGWLYEYLLGQQARLDPDSPYDGSVNDSTDNWLQTNFLSQPWQGEIEFIQGLAGLAPYVARRAKYQPDHPMIANFLQRIEQLAEKEIDGLRWPTPKDSPYNLLDGEQEIEVNLGIAHGMPSILAALLAIAESATKTEHAYSLLQQGVNWLYAHQQTIDVGSYYGYAAGKEECSRLGWCYGDLPIALIFARAGRLLNNVSWLDFGKKIALHASARRERNAGVFDAGLCHGSVGLALIFNMLNQIYVLDELDSAKEYWFNEAMQRFKTGGIGGLKPYREANSAGVHLPTHDFLGGTSGVGLGLLALINNRQDWIDALLLA